MMGRRTTGSSGPARRRRSAWALGTPDDRALWIGYTQSMKIAVSVPDDVFKEAEELARRTKRSRSDVYSRALAEYVARHAPDRVTEAMDRVLADIGDPADHFVRTASRRVLKRSDW